MFDAIRANARSLCETSDASSRTQVFADVCAARKIEFDVHELSSRVVIRSLNRIDCVVAFALLLFLAEFAWPARIHLSGDALAAFAVLANVVIAASTRSIGKALSRQS